ncbi:MAG: ABC transporter substrate-binding protein [Oscillospiraceae bacterium]|nr:ABC transporter substrate-binding protein [Oscillospiraceae bacterium]
MKKFLALALTLAMALTMLAGCGSSASSSTPAASSSTATSEAAKGSVYFLNFKPEQDEAYQAIAKEYSSLTGVDVKVVTAASGTYEQQLKSEIAKTDAPTIFQVNGPVGYAAWKDYCADLSGTDLYSHLLDKSIAITDGSGVYGIPFVIEGYGIIYNKKILAAYTAMDGAVVKSADEIVDFATLKAVVEDMQAKKDALSIKGVFAATSLATGEDWRWQTHLANVPVYYEFQKNNVDLGDTNATAEIKFEFGQQFKNLFDLYINNSTCAPTLLGSKSVDDSMAEFALGQCAMVQNGNWAYGQISGVDGNTVKPEDVAFLPMFIGAEGEKGQGICIGTENFFCINGKASAENQQASIDFLTWLYTDAAGMAHVTNDLGFIAPFDTFGDDVKPSDPLAQDVLAWSGKANTNNVPWNFTVFPSQTFKDNFGAALLEYAQGTKTWDDVNTVVVDGWKTEKANAAG